ncbi:gamma-interferon inducible lysosomal thiol reductase [Nesidiocoris tenuis]|uniref:Gamma-interferon inducible lysosomal thiol reductase n=1 Tax=Nesidiocoris tenuis TaxID=355587 RepID=A0ABN7ACF2_9HEMI|nr:gamma-interferon inducible lysosomal thiol reductase [Nesidiocoris tenuis]
MPNWHRTVSMIGIIISLLAIGTPGLSKVLESTKRLHIDVFYESLCSDSRDFFINQLRPTILELAAYIDVDLIPYGKAKTTILPDTRITSTCQHGHEECYGNRIHACALALSTANNLQKVFFAACLFDEFDTALEMGGEKCSKRLGFNWKDIRNCANSHLGFALQYNHGIQTQALKPSVTFIPTIVVDQRQGDSAEQNIRLKNFYSVVCRELKLTMMIPPGVCNVQKKVPA